LPTTLTAGAEFLLGMVRPGEDRERNHSDWAFLREAASSIRGAQYDVGALQGG
jgi:hypothetical protein